MPDPGSEWAMQDSNLRPLACRSRALSPYPLQPGASLSFGEDSAEYHRSAGVSASQLKDFLTSATLFHRKHVLRVHSPPATAALERGTLVHLWAEVGEEEFLRRVAVIPPALLTESGARSRSKKADEWAASLAPGQTIVTQAELDSILEQCHAITANSAARDLLDAVQWREFSVRWVQNGVAMRCRADAATPDTWVDIKTTRDVKPLDTWWRSVRDFGYATQAAVYRWAARAAGWPEHNLHFVVTSTTYPFDCQVVVLPTWLVDQAELRATLALEQIADRIALDHWLPEGSGEVHVLDVPNFLREE